MYSLRNFFKSSKRSLISGHIGIGAMLHREEKDDSKKDYFSWIGNNLIWSQNDCGSDKFSHDC